MTTYKDKRDEITSSAKSQREQLARFAKQFPFMPEWIDQLNSQRNNIHAYFGYQYGGTVDIRINNLDGFKGDDLLSILEEVESTFNVELTGTDNPVGRCKEFTADVKWGSTLNIYVHANLANDSKLCQRVVVSVRTETIEVPEYRLECA
jgi:hypothetical protein